MKCLKLIYNRFETNYFFATVFLAVAGLVAVVFATGVLAGDLATGFLAGAFATLALGVVTEAFLDASSLTPACLALFAKALFRRPAVCLLITFFLTAVSIAL